MPLEHLPPAKLRISLIIFPSKYSPSLTIFLSRWSSATFQKSDHTVVRDVLCLHPEVSGRLPPRRHKRRSNYGCTAGTLCTCLSRLPFSSFQISFYNEASSLPGPPHCFFGCFVVVVAAEQRQSSHRVCSSAHNPQKLSIIHKKCMWGCNLEPKSSVPIEMNEKASIPSFCRMVCNENILFRHGARTLCDTFEPCDGHKAF